MSHGERRGSCPSLADVHSSCTAGTFIVSDASQCYIPISLQDEKCRPPVTTDVHMTCGANKFIGSLTDGSTCRDPRPTDPSYCDTATNNFIDSDASCKPVDIKDVHMSCDVSSAITATFGPCVPCAVDAVGLYHCTELPSEFKINTYTIRAQINPAVAGLITGGYVIVWQSFEQDGSNWGIYAQAYDQDHNTVGAEFQVNTYTISDQRFPSIAGLITGGYVITWRSFGQDGNSGGIYAQAYDKDHNTVGADFQVNTYTINDQTFPSIAGLITGGYVITWQSSNQDGDRYGIYAQAYDKDHNTVGAEFQVNTYTTDDQRDPSIAGLITGGYVIIWRSLGQDGDGYGIYAQAYDKDHNTVGAEFQVNTYTTSDQTVPSIAGLITRRLCYYLAKS